MEVKRNTLRVVFFGDSICKGTYIDISKGWVYRIANSLQDIDLSRDLVVANESINGNTTRQALERMHRITEDGHQDIQNDGVDVLLIQFGLNDCNIWHTDKGLPRVNPEAFRANLKEIINRGEVSGAEEIILNTNHPTTLDSDPLPNSDSTYEDQNKRYNTIIREVSESAEVNLIDMGEIFRQHISKNGYSNSELVTGDGLHLSEEGHGIYYESVFPEIRYFVERVDEK